MINNDDNQKVLLSDEPLKGRSVFKKPSCNDRPPVLLWAVLEGLQGLF
jgi:hypothetical protein